MEAAELLAAQGVDAEVLDLRVLRPLDEEAILATVARTHRVVVSDNGGVPGAWPPRSPRGSPREGGFFELDAPVARVCSAEVPIPYARHLEEAALPQADRVVAAARRTVGADV